jgi:hypothetical protein
MEREGCTERHGSVWLTPYGDNQRDDRLAGRRPAVAAARCETSAATPTDFTRAELTRRGQPAVAD